MEDSDPLLMITIWNKNNNCKYRIQLNEAKSIKELKEDCKQSLRFGNIDKNKINLYFIDDDEDKNIINEFNDLIEYSNINRKNDNLSIELFAELSEEKENIINKKNNLNLIKNNNNKIIDDKDRKIYQLNAEKEFLMMELKKYKEQYKKKTDYIEKKIVNSNKVEVEPKKENKELSHENNKNNINAKLQNENINDLNLEAKDINLKKNLLYRQDILFIYNKCNNCGKQNEKNIFKCVSCDNYYLCINCHKVNKNKTIHEHQYFFEITFPVELIKKIKTKEKNDVSYYEVIFKFNDFLNSIFFDKNGNLSKKQFTANKSNIEKFENLCIDMNKIKVDPLKYFEDYKKETINLNIEKIEKNGEHEDIKLAINENLNIISNNLFKYVPENK